jgi:pimeloyl-ACP methyl ester carboxylesterase
MIDPPGYGGRAEDAFDLVLPSMPGYGFSGRLQVTGWNPDHIARAWAELMRRLGYTRYVSQGGDWGAVVSDVMARQAPPEIAKALQAGDPPPSGLTPEEKAAYEQMNALYTKGSGYALMMVTRPQTLGYSGAPLPLIRSGLSMYGIWSRSGGTGSTASSCLTAIAEPSWAPAVSTANISPASSKSAARRLHSGARLRPSSAIMPGCFWRCTPAYNSWVSAGRPLPGGTPGKISPKGAFPSSAACSMPMWLAAPIARWPISCPGPDL